MGIENVTPGGTPIVAVMEPSKYLSPVTQKRIATRQLESRIIDRMNDLADAAFDLALGVSVVGEEGRIYHKPPDRETIKMLWERGLGKPVEHIEVMVNGTPLDDVSPELLALVLVQEGVTAQDVMTANLDNLSSDELALELTRNGITAEEIATAKLDDE